MRVTMPRLFRNKLIIRACLHARPQPFFRKLRQYFCVAEVGRCA